MKKIAIASTALLFSSIVLSSEARIDVFGGGLNHGSIWVEDEDNSLYNPVLLSKFHNYIIYEKDASGGNGSGGLTYKYNNYYLGAYINKKNPLDASMMALLAAGIGHKDGGAVVFKSTGLTSVANLDSRPITVMGAIDMGFKLGVGLHYNSGSSTNPVVTAYNPKYKQMEITFGGEYMKLYPFLTYGLSKKLSMDTDGVPAGQTANQKLAAGSISSVSEKPITIGAQYEYEMFNPYFYYQKSSDDVEMWDGDKTLSTSGFYKTSTFAIGGTKTFDYRDGKVYTALGLNTLKITTDSGVPNTKVEASCFSIPAMLGTEYSAANWITFMAAGQFDLINTRKTTTTVATGSSEFKAPQAGNAKASLGAKLKFNKLEFDFTASRAQGRNVGFEAATFTDLAVKYSL